MTKFKRQILPTVGLFLSAFPVFGCSTITMTVKVNRPAQIDIGRYRQIAIEAVKNDTNGQMAEMLKSSLTESSRFIVLDRQNSAAVAQEQKLAASGAAAEGQGPQLGKTLVASAVLVGTVNDQNYRETMQTQAVVLPGTDGQLHQHTKYIRHGEAIVHATLQITDVETSQIVKDKRFKWTEKGQTEGMDVQPARLDSERMKEVCKRRIVRQFIDAITPHEATLKVTFFKNGRMPQMETAATLIQAAQYDDAIRILTEALDAGDKSGIPSDVMGMAYWNRGLAYEYSGKYEQARTDVKKAFTYTNNADLMGELKNIDQLQHDETVFAEQTAPAPAETGAESNSGAAGM